MPTEQLQAGGHVREGRDMHYSMVIQWEPQGRVYVVTVPELPGCVTHGNTYEEAARQGMDTIDTWIMGEDPATLPPPQFYQLGEAIQA
jgi:predicted RNase H-like HicB family nuclease